MNKRTKYKPISLKKFNRIRDEKGTVNAIAECYIRAGMTGMGEIAESLGELINYVGNVRELELLDSEKLTLYVNEYSEAIRNEKAVKQEWCIH